jgi:CspA family cold shock protein
MLPRRVDALTNDIVGTRAGEGTRVRVRSVRWSGSTERRGSTIRQKSRSGGIPMAVGRVKWFNDEKGWGFIKQDTGPDVFVHYSQIQGEGRRRLYEDEVVEFEIKEGPKGLQAVNVTRQNGAGAVS